MDNLTPMNTAELMDRAISVYKQSFFKQILFAGIYYLVSFFALLFLGGFIAIFIAIIVAATVQGASTSAVSTTIVIITLAVAIGILWFAVSQAGHIILSKQAFFGERVKLMPKPMVKISLRVFGTIFAQVLAMLPFVGFVILFYAATTTSFFDAIWAYIISAIIFIFLFFLYFHMFSLSIAVSVFERKTFFWALIRSWQLVKDEYWKTFGARILWLLASSTIWATYYGIIGFLAFGFEFLADTFNLAAGWAVFFGFIVLILGLLSIAIYFAVAPLDGVFHTTMYFNQRIKKEGLDIELKLSELERELNHVN